MFCNSAWWWRQLQTQLTRTWLKVKSTGTAHITDEQCQRFFFFFSHPGGGSFFS